MTYPMVSKAPRYDLNAPQLRDLLLAMIPTPDDVLAGLASGTRAPMAMPEACRDRHDLVAAAAGYESVANVHSRGLAKLRAAAESFRGVDPCDSDQYILVVESDKDRLRNALHTLEDVMRERGWTVTVVWSALDRETLVREDACFRRMIEDGTLGPEYTLCVNFLTLLPRELAIPCRSLTPS